MVVGFLCHCVEFLCVLQTMATKTEQSMLELEIINIKKELRKNLLKLLQHRKEETVCTTIEPTEAEGGCTYLQTSSVNLF